MKHVLLLFENFVKSSVKILIF